MVMKIISRLKLKLYIVLLKYSPKKRLSGINIVGLLNSSIGLGRASRLVCQMFDKYDEIPTKKIILNCNNNAKELNTIKKDVSKDVSGFVHSINLEMYNPDILFHMRLQGGVFNWLRCYNIGYWVWELEQIPKRWIEAAEYLDEIWVPSQFVKDAIGNLPCPVYVIPYPIQLEKNNKMIDLNSHGIKVNDFVFFVLFDVLSYIERKNPYVAIDAFIKIYEDLPSNTKLLIKVNNGHAKQSVIKNLQNYIDPYSRIVLLDTVLSEEEMNYLYKRIDVLVSTHRAEGFGLALAEAMLSGKPVIATGWSGNLEFMSKNNSCLVNYKLIPIEKRTGPYEENLLWADPYIDDVSKYMKKLYFDKDYYNTISKNAESIVRKKLSSEVVYSFIHERYMKIVNKTCF